LFFAVAVVVGSVGGVDVGADCLLRTLAVSSSVPVCLISLTIEAIRTFEVKSRAHAGFLKESPLDDRRANLAALLSVLMWMSASLTGCARAGACGVRVRACTCSAYRNNGREAHAIMLLACNDPKKAI
jgi:hypothetical protein